MKYRFALIAGIIVLLSVCTICASEGSKISIRSEYTDLTDQYSVSTIIYEFIPTDDKGRFDVYIKGSSDKVLSLVYSEEGRLKSVTKWITSGTGKKEVKTEYNEKLVLSEGFPVPYDYLACDDLTLSQVKLLKHTSGVSFSTIVTRQIEKIFLKDAIQLEMIDKSVMPYINEKQLKLISIFKGSGLMVRQLWVDGDPFWIFEETPIRKSWKIEP